MSKKILVGSVWAEQFGFGSHNRTVSAVSASAKGIRTECACGTQEEFADNEFLSRFIWLSDPPAKIPAPGVKVRVTEIAPFDDCPDVKVGDEFFPARVAACRSTLAPAGTANTWLYVERLRGRLGTWCRVEEPPAEAEAKAEAPPKPEASPPGYAPKVGERVRVLEIKGGYAPLVETLKVGDEIEVAEVHNNYSAELRGFVCIHPPGGRGGAWVKVAKVEAKPAPQPITLGSVWRSAIDYTVISVDASPARPYRLSYKHRIDGDERETGDGPYSEETLRRFFTFVRDASPLPPPRQLETPEVREVLWGSRSGGDAALEARMLHNRDVARIQSAIDAVGPNALGLLADLAERLVKGKAQGDFEMRRDWRREAYEEDLDGVIYRTLDFRQGAAL